MASRELLWERHTTRLARERDDALAEVERLREALQEISRVAGGIVLSIGSIQLREGNDETSPRH
jgi:hypothetical protein